MNRNVVEQEREIGDMLWRAKNSSDRRSSVRHETLKRLIDLAHCEYTSLKVLSAGNIRLFLTDFPDLEEAAIDAIYDLCEDSSQKVRIEGYRAITQVSKVQSKWIKRNADVLVQLLQSEEVDEAVEVKKALAEHLEMDPKITLGVLCDQIVPWDVAADEEEISIRKRLRSLVLAFMAKEAKSAICERYAIPEESGEPVLYEGLFAAIPGLEADDLQLIIKDLIYALPAFKSRRLNERGSELLQLLLTEKVTPALKADLQGSPGAPTLRATRPLLEMCEHIACVLHVAPAVDLVQFYCSSLIGKITLQKFQMVEQQWIVCRLARGLDVAAKQEDSRLLSFRRTIVDACPYLLEVFNKPSISENEVETTYGVFLQACLERTRQSSWTLPSHLFRVLQDFQKRPEVKQNKEYEKIIRSLAPSNQTPGSSPPQFDTTLSALRLQTPSTFPLRAPMLKATSASPNPAKPVHNKPVSTVQQPTGVKRDVDPDTSARPVKRTKVKEDSSTAKVPSLLSRLGNSLNHQSSRSDLSSRSASPTPGDDSLSQPGHGISIKGAAAKQAKQNSSSSSRVVASSLLERLRDPYTGGTGIERSQHDVGKRRNI